jgi:hypothetical protein
VKGAAHVRARGFAREQYLERAAIRWARALLALPCAACAAPLTTDNPNDSPPPVFDTSHDAGGQHDASPADSSPDTGIPVSPSGYDAGSGFSGGGDGGIDAGSTDGVDADAAAPAPDAGAPEPQDAGAPADAASGIPTPAGCTQSSYGGHTYLFCSKTKTFADARTACIGYGLDLAIVGDQAENDFIHAGASTDQWLGLTDLDKEGQFRWVVPGNDDQTKGNSVSFTDWNDGEPNNDQSCVIPVVLCTDEDCGEMTPSGQWNDADCTKKYAYVCETY